MDLLYPCHELCLHSFQHFFLTFSFNMLLTNLGGVEGYQQGPAISEEYLHSVVSQLPPALVHLFDLLICPGKRRCLRLPVKTLFKHKSLTLHVTQCPPLAEGKANAVKSFFTWLSWASAALSSTKYIPDFPVTQDRVFEIWCLKKKTHKSFPHWISNKHLCVRAEKYAHVAQREHIILCAFLTSWVYYAWSSCERRSVTYPEVAPLLSLWRGRRWCTVWWT